MLRTSLLLHTLQSCKNSIRNSSIRRITQASSYQPLPPRFTYTFGHKCVATRYQTIASRSFHSTRPQNVPILPLPAVILGILKSGKLVSFVSLSSKTSLTLLPHSIFRRYKFSTKVFASVPLIGIALLLTVGLDKVMKINCYINI